MILENINRLGEVEAGKRILVLDKCDDWDVFLQDSEGFVYHAGSGRTYTLNEMSKYYKGFKVLNSENVEIL